MKLKFLKSRVAKNAGWLIACRIIQSILGFVISIFTARYLGPSNFGLINYAASIVAFVLPIMQLGATGILVQDLTQNPEEEGKIMCTSISMSLISGLFCILGVYLFTLVANPGETTTTIVCVLYALMLIPQALELIIYWYQAKLLSKYTSIVSLISYLIVSGYKIFLLITEQDVIWFAISYSIDYFLISVVLIIIYRKLGAGKFSFSKAVAKRLFNKGKYYIISNLMIVVFANTDRIMLKLMIDDAATGYYSAAAAIAGMVSFVYTAIIDSFRPLVFQHKKDGNEEEYNKSLITLYGIVIYLALIQSTVMTIAAPLIINVVYGDAFTPSIVALQIVVWYTTFSYYGGAKDVWILGEQKQKYLVWLNMSGAIANIGLNFLLIPIMGINGAALASLITQFFINIVMMIIIKPLRMNQLLLLKSLNPVNIIKNLKG